MAFFFSVLYWACSFR